jgi:hypothetical protein
MGLGFVGARGAQGAQDALAEIIAQRKVEELLAREEEQRQFENAMQTRQADTSDSRFDRTQGFTERTGEANLALNRDEFGLRQQDFGLRQGQQNRNNTIEDARLRREEEQRKGLVTWLRKRGAENPNDASMFEGLEWGVDPEKGRTPTEAGAAEGRKVGATWSGGGKMVASESADIQVDANNRINASSEARAAARAAERGVSPQQTQEAIETAREARRLAGALLEHPAMVDVFGVMREKMPTLRQGTADAESILNSLTGLLTLDNMGKMKGVLSDNDMKILKAASTTLNQKMSPEAAKVELERLLSLDLFSGGDGNMVTDRSNSAVPTTAPPDQSGQWRWNGQGWIPRMAVSHGGG